MSTAASKNRWLIAASAMLIHLSIGSVYAYSVYQRPLQEMQGWSIADVTLGFTVAIVTLGLSAAFLGRYVERYGPRLSGTVAAILFAGGTILAGVAVGRGSHTGFVGRTASSPGSGSDWGISPPSRRW